MNKNRKRITISLDVETYEELQKMCKQYGVDNCPTLLVAFSHLLIDCMTDADKRRLNMADGDRAYLAAKFDDMGHYIKQPDGTVPIRGHKIDIDTIWRRTKNTED